MFLISEFLNKLYYNLIIYIKTCSSKLKNSKKSKRNQNKNDSKKLLN